MDTGTCKSTNLFCQKLVKMAKGLLEKSFLKYMGTRYLVNSNLSPNSKPKPKLKKAIILELTLVITLT